jgi:hypothetical protein
MRGVVAARMAKRIISIALVVLIAVVAWFAWSRRGVDTAMDSGAVVSHDSPADTDKMNQGAVDLDGNAVDSATGGTGSSGPTGSAHAATGQTGSTRMAVAAAAATGALQSMSASPAPAGVPAMDSQAENAPNGARFGGGGKFEWYRQGNITWRINTQSGSMCIAFATMEEWRKPIVSNHGCGNA